MKTTWAALLLLGLANPVWADDENAMTPVDLEKTCLAGNADHCRTLALRYRDGDGGATRDAARQTQFAEKAAALYDKECAAGDSGSCINLSFMLGANELPKDDARRAATMARAGEISQRDCDAGKAAACYRLAGFYDDQPMEGFSTDLGRSRALYEKACALDHATGCMMVGWTLDKAGDVAGAGAAWRRSAGLHEKECEAGNAESCSHLGDMLRDGRGVSADQGRAARMLWRACELGEDVACSNWHNIKRWVGLPQVESGADVAALTKSCEAGAAADCTKAAAALPDEARGQKHDLLFKACRGGDPAGCRLWAHESELRATLGFDRARSAYEEACGHEGPNGDAQACEVAGFMHAAGEGAKASAERAKELYARSVSLLESACNGPTGGPACERLARAYEHGFTPAGSDSKKAAALYEKACEAGQGDACFRMAGLYRVGQGVVRDKARADVFQAKACAAGVEPACPQKPAETK